MSLSVREVRALMRKAKKRVPEGEDIRHLNIMPMMDIMTVLLVAFITLSAADSLDVGDSIVPTSQTMEEVPDKATTVMIGPETIMVDEALVVKLTAGKVDAGDLEGGATGRKITLLTEILGGVRAKTEQKMKELGKPVTTNPPLWIIADRHTSYELLFKVLYSAKQPGPSYKNFRLIVHKSDKAKK